MTLKSADIVLVRGKSWTSWLIRVFTRAPGEPRTLVDHVGVMVSSTEVVESLRTTIERPFTQVLNPKVKVTVVRRKELTQIQKDAISQKALSYVGRKYGWFKILAHGVDRLLGNVYLFRRIARVDKYPICSWVVAYAYDSIGLDFGVPPWAADPDDIDDYTRAHPELFEQVNYDQN